MPALTGMNFNVKYVCKYTQKCDYREKERGKNKRGERANKREKERGKERKQIVEQAVLYYMPVPLECGDKVTVSVIVYKCKKNCVY